MQLIRSQTTKSWEKTYRCLSSYLKKAVKLTKTDMDDKLLEQVEKAIVAR